MPLIVSPLLRPPYADLSYYFVHKGVLFVQLDNYGPGPNERAQYYALDGHVTPQQVTALASLSKKMYGKYTSVVMAGHVPPTQLLGNSWRIADSLFSEFVGIGGKYYFAGHVHAYRPAADVKQIAGLKQVIVGTAGAPQENDYPGNYGYLLVGVANGRLVADSLWNYRQVS